MKITARETPMPTMTLSGRRSIAARTITFVLRHPAVMRIKHRMRDVLWQFKARSLRNPVLSTPVRSVLFVCFGNICRSPFAEAMCRKLLAEAGSDAPCASAGIRTTQAARPPAEACEAARRAGLSLDAHEPIQLTRELVDNYDVIVVMEAGQMQSLRTAYPDAANRTVLLPLYDGDRSAGYERYNIADPFGQSPAAFDACYDRIQLSLARFLDHAGLCPTGNVEVHARTEEGAAAADDGGDADRKNARASSHRDRR